MPTLDHKILDLLYQQYKQTGIVTTDNRTVTAGSIFFALRGEKFDGNQFAVKAVESGASLAVVDDPQLANQPGCLLVPDVLTALQALATWHRQQLQTTVIAVCGSNGKTTTKELLARVLGSTYKTFATPGNLNNHIGVPLSILKMDQSHAFAVLELGANGPDEIAFLSKIAQPDYAVITNIGKDHLEGFGSVEGVAQANGEVFDYLLAHKGNVFVNTTEKEVVKLASRFSAPITYPGSADSFHYELTNAAGFIEVKSAKGTVIKTRLLGAFNFANVATALAIGSYFKVEEDTAAEAVYSYVPSNMRSQVVDSERNTILLDAYNANPSSMELALRNLEDINWQGLPKAFFIGDMRELGADSPTEHTNIGKLASTLGSVAVKAFVGKEMKLAAEACPSSLHFPDTEAAIQWIAQQQLAGHFILLKGSRGMAMEKLLPAL